MRLDDIPKIEKIIIDAAYSRAANELLYDYLPGFYDEYKEDYDLDGEFKEIEFTRLIKDGLCSLIDEKILRRQLKQ